LDSFDLDLERESCLERPDFAEPLDLERPISLPSSSATLECLLLAIEKRFESTSDDALLKDILVDFSSSSIEAALAISSRSTDS